MQPVKKLRATFPIESMFAPDSYRLRPVSILLLDQIVAALSLSPDGVRLELEFVVRAEYLAENVFPIDQT